MNARRIVRLLVLGVALGPPAASAKTVVCVDGAPDLSGYEGFVSTQITVPPDVVQVGGTITACMGKLEKGDQLIIIAHGYTDPGPPKKLGFIWQGTKYTGFGAGAGKYPVPAGFAALNHIGVTMGSCWSSRDPDGAGGQPPVTESLQGAMLGGAGNTVSGFSGAAGNNTLVDVGNPDHNSGQQIQAAKDWLNQNQNRWRNRAPAGNKRNPPPATNEQSEAKRLIDSVFAGKNIPVTVRYTPIRDNRRDPFESRLATIESSERIPGLAGIPSEDTTSCPYTYVYFLTTNSLPGAPSWGMIVLLVVLTGSALAALTRRAPASTRA